MQSIDCSTFNLLPIEHSDFTKHGVRLQIVDWDQLPLLTLKAQKGDNGVSLKRNLSNETTNSKLVWFVRICNLSCVMAAV